MTKGNIGKMMTESERVRRGPRPRGRALAELALAEQEAAELAEQEEQQVQPESEPESESENQSGSEADATRATHCVVPPVAMAGNQPRSRFSTLQTGLQELGIPLLPPAARARNSNRMRGGFTTRKRLSQLTQQELFAALEELPADVVKKIGKRHPLLIPPLE